MAARYYGNQAHVVDTLNRIVGKLQKASRELGPKDLAKYTVDGAAQDLQILLASLNEGTITLDKKRSDDYIASVEQAKAKAAKGGES